MLLQNYANSEVEFQAPNVRDQTLTLPLEGTVNILVPPLPRLEKVG